MIIFEGERLFLHYYEGSSDYIIITFVGIGESYKAGNSFFLYPIVKKYNISCLGITCKVDNFYLHHEINQIINLCNDITKDYKKIIVMGLSMGGYGALKYSKSLNADVVFAMAPQCTLDEKVCNIEDYVKLIIEKLPKNIIEQSTIGVNDVKGKIYCVYDPFGSPHTDSINYTILLQNLTNIVPIPTYYTGHVIVHHLQGSQEMKSIIDALVDGDDNKVRNTVINIRRHHIANIIYKASLAVRKHPLLVYNMLTSEAFLQVKNNYCLLQDFFFG